MNLQRLLEIGSKILATPSKPGRPSEETMESDGDFTYNDAFTAPPAQEDNMTILHRAMTHNETNIKPSASSEVPDDAVLYKEFCSKAGIIGTTEGYFLWLRERKNPVSTQPSPMPLTIAETPANNTGKIQVIKLATAGVLSNSFVSVKILCGFSKTEFVMAALYEVYRHLRHSAGMGEISLSTIWSLLTVNTVTPTICGELVLAQYDKEVLAHADAERPIRALLRVFEVFMDPLTVLGLRSIAVQIGEADDRKGYGAATRLECFLFILHRLAQDALHGQHTQIDQPFDDLITSEITDQALTTAYFATTTATRLREKDAQHALDIRAVNARFDKMQKSSHAAGSSGRVVTSTASTAPADKPEICLRWARSASLCYEPCPNKRLHSWPDTMPLKTKNYLLTLAAKIPLPLAGDSAGASSGASTAGSRRFERTPRRGSSQDSSPSTASVVSSLSGNEDPV